MSKTKPQAVHGDISSEGIALYLVVRSAEDKVVKGGELADVWTDVHRRHGQTRQKVSTSSV